MRSSYLLTKRTLTQSFKGGTELLLARCQKLHTVPDLSSSHHQPPSLLLTPGQAQLAPSRLSIRISPPSLLFDVCPSSPALSASFFLVARSRVSYPRLLFRNWHPNPLQRSLTATHRPSQCLLEEALAALARTTASNRALLRSVADLDLEPHQVGAPLSSPPPPSYTCLAHARTPFHLGESCWRAMEPNSNPSLTRIFPRDRLRLHDHARFWEHHEQY